MSDFDFDAMQKKNIARSAYARKTGARPRKVTMPSDYLTTARKKELNGKMATYNLSKPMTFAEFKAMPQDLQREYISKLRNTYHASAMQIGKMLGCADETARRIIRDLNFDTSLHLLMNPEQKQRWLAWQGIAPDSGSDEPIVDPEEQPNTEPENKAEPIAPTAPTAPTAPIAPTAPTCGAMQGGKLRLAGTAEEILDSLRTVFAAMGANKMDAMISFNLYRKAEVQK